VVRSIAGTGDLRIMEGDDHLLTNSHDVMFEEVLKWLKNIFEGIEQ
jgi:hypothetical protein